MKVANFHIPVSPWVLLVILLTFVGLTALGPVAALGAPVWAGALQGAVMAMLTTAGVIFVAKGGDSTAVTPTNYTVDLNNAKSY